jgi:hypothetical protein
LFEIPCGGFSQQGKTVFEEAGFGFEPIFTTKVCLKNGLTSR